MPATGAEWGQWLGGVAWGAGQAYVLLNGLYVLLPALYYLARRRTVERQFLPTARAAPATRFVLLVPARNEEAVLPELLASVRALDYPAHLLRLVVVADNCTDRTAQLARQAGAECLERHTPAPSSKAQALGFATEALGLGNGRAVVCVLDADCRLAPSFLRELDRQFAAPGAAPVLQCSREVGNAFASDVTVLDAAAEALRERVLAGVREQLGLQALIFGLGCCAREDVFRELVALPGSSLAEDKEWKVYLTRQAIAVRYCAAARLSYLTVATPGAFAQQRRRWLTGHLATVRAHAPALLAQALRTGRLAPLDCALDLLQPPRSLLLLGTLAAAGGAALAPGWALLPAWAWLGLAAGVLAYGALGLRLIGARVRHLWLLVSGVRLVGIMARSLAAVVLGGKDKHWRPTR